MTCNTCVHNGKFPACPTPAFSSMMGDDHWDCPFFRRPNRLDLSKRIENLWISIVDDHEIKMMERYV